jgi:cytochrome c peroxidase
MKARASLFTLLLLATAGCGGTRDEPFAISPRELIWESVPSGDARAVVGEKLFFDTSLSSPAGQSCASCHREDRAFTAEASQGPTSEGAIQGRFGARNAPTAMYAAASPAFHSEFRTEGKTFLGGQFWDGRASSLEAQAKGPLLNPIEMNNPDAAAVIAKVKAAAYRPLFEAAFGADALDDVDAAFDHVAEAIAAFERTPRFLPFSSKYDAYLAGTATLSPAEARGLAIFEDGNKGRCATCHPSQPNEGSPPLFTDFKFENLGIPRNPDNPFYKQPASINPDGASYVDRGLGGVLGDSRFDGLFKAPTLRNITRTAPYTHAGYFKDLESIVHFYNTRDTDPTWPAPEVPDTMNDKELGNLGLTDAEEDDLVAFLHTLEDGWDGSN